MKHIHRLMSLSLLFSATALPGAFADGFRNPPPTAQSIAKGGAVLSSVDDPSAVILNPANLTQAPDGAVQVSVMLAHLKTEFKEAGTGTRVKADDPWQPLPSLSAVWRATPESRVTYGLAISSPYGQSVEWDQQELAAVYPGCIYFAEMKVVNFSPGAAIALNDQVSIGVAADLFYSTLDMKQDYPAFVPGSRLKAETDGTGIGAHAGLTWKMTDRQTASIVVRSPVKVEYNGTLELNNFPGAPPAPPGTSAKSDLSTEITFPASVGLGYALQITEKLQVEAILEWIEWSSYDKLTLDAKNNNPLLNIATTAGPEPAVLPQKWKDTITFGLGAKYLLNEKWTLYSGYTFLESPIPDQTADPSLPDADRHIVSLGAGWKSGGHQLDVSYAYSIYRTRSTSDNPQVNGRYDLNADLLGLTYTYEF